MALHLIWVTAGHGWIAVRELFINAILDCKVKYWPLLNCVETFNRRFIETLRHCFSVCRQNWSWDWLCCNRRVRPSMLTVHWVHQSTERRHFLDMFNGRILYDGQRREEFCAPSIFLRPNTLDHHSRQRMISKTVDIQQRIDDWSKRNETIELCQRSGAGSDASRLAFADDYTFKWKKLIVLVKEEGIATNLLTECK